MKLEVLRCDGQSEVVNIVGSCEFREPREENGQVVGQGSIYCQALGMRYFFRADGRYDGWEAEVSMPIPTEDAERMKADPTWMPPALERYLDEIESGRDVRPDPGKG